MAYVAASLRSQKQSASTALNTLQVTTPILVGEEEVEQFPPGHSTCFVCIFLGKGSPEEKIKQRYRLSVEFLSTSWQESESQVHV